MPGTTERLCAVTSSFSGSQQPRGLPIYARQNVLGQCHGRTARGVFFLHVVHFVQRDVVFRKPVHHPGQLTVHGKKDIDADAVIGGVKEGASVPLAYFGRFGQAVQPCGGSAHHRYAGFEAGDDIAVSRSRSGELDRHVACVKILGRKLVRIIEVDDQRDRMPSRHEYLLDFVSHFAVAYQCDFHNKVKVIHKKLKTKSVLFLAFQGLDVFRLRFTGRWSLRGRGLPR